MDSKHNEQPVSIPSALASLPGPYQPKHILTYNSNSVRVAQLNGTFIWHSHPETDELFYIVSGGPFNLEIANSKTNDETDGYGVVTMNPGDMYLVPQGRRHRPNAEFETRVLFFNKTGTVNTGDAADSEAGRARTVFVDEGGA